MIIGTHYSGSRIVIYLKRDFYIDAQILPGNTLDYIEVVRNGQAIRKTYSFIKDAPELIITWIKEYQNEYQCYF